MWGKLGTWTFISGMFGLGVVLYVAYANGGAISSLSGNPSQAILFAALLTIFVWTFNLFFNSFIQADRSRESKQLRKEIEELKAAVLAKKKDAEPSPQGQVENSEN